MLPWARSPIPAVALAVVLVACSTPPSEVNTTGDPSSSDTSAGTTTTAMPGTTLVDEETSASTTAEDTTVGVGDTTTSESSDTNNGTGPDPGCMNPEDCGSNQDCQDGICVSACGGSWGQGSYGYCLTEFGDFGTDDLCGPDHLCVFWNDPIEQTACTRQGCVDACECPPPPDTGNATVTCGQITADPGMNDCYLACGEGVDCPDGMTCNDSDVCVTAVPEIPIYGDCGNLASDCAAPGFCVGVVSGEAVCTTSCLDASECPAAVPPGGSSTIACTDIDPTELGFECYVSCVGGLSCPDGMTCINGTLCMWQD